MSDSVLPALQDAKTILGRALLRCEPGETRSRIELARKAVEDAIEQRGEDNTSRTLRRLEVIADALAAPGKDAA